MRIRYKTLGGAAGEGEVEVGGATVGDLREAILAAIAEDGGQQTPVRIIFAGRVLRDDGELLSARGLHDGVVVHVVRQAQQQQQGSSASPAGSSPSQGEQVPGGNPLRAGQPPDMQNPNVNPLAAVGPVLSMVFGQLSQPVTASQLSGQQQQQGDVAAGQQDPAAAGAAAGASQGQAAQAQAQQTQAQQLEGIGNLISSVISATMPPVSQQQQTQQAGAPPPPQQSEMTAASAATVPQPPLQASSTSSPLSGSTTGGGAEALAEIWGLVAGSEVPPEPADDFQPTAQLGAVMQRTLTAAHSLLGPQGAVASLATRFSDQNSTQSDERSARALAERSHAVAPALGHLGVALQALSLALQNTDSVVSNPDEIDASAVADVQQWPPVSAMITQHGLWNSAGDAGSAAAAAAGPGGPLRRSAVPLITVTRRGNLASSSMAPAAAAPSSPSHAPPAQAPAQAAAPAPTGTADPFGGLLGSVLSTVSQSIAAQNPDAQPGTQTDNASLLGNVGEAIQAFASIPRGDGSDAYSTSGGASGGGGGAGMASAMSTILPLLQQAQALTGSGQQQQQQQQQHQQQQQQTQAQAQPSQGTTDTAPITSAQEDSSMGEQQQGTDIAVSRSQWLMGHLNDILGATAPNDFMDVMQNNWAPLVRRRLRLRIHTLENQLEVPLRSKFRNFPGLASFDSNSEVAVAIRATPTTRLLDANSLELKKRRMTELHRTKCSDFFHRARAAREIVFKAGFEEAPEILADFAAERARTVVELFLSTPAEVDDASFAAELQNEARLFAFGLHGIVLESVDGDVVAAEEAVLQQLCSNELSGAVEALQAVSGLPLAQVLSTIVPGGANANSDALAAAVLLRAIHRLAQQHEESLVAANTDIPREWHARLLVDELRQQRKERELVHNPARPQSRALTGAEAQVPDTTQGLINQSLASGDPDTAQLLANLPPVLRERYLQMVRSEFANSVEGDADIRELSSREGLDARLPNIAALLEQGDVSEDAGGKMEDVGAAPDPE